MLNENQLNKLTYRDYYRRLSLLAKGVFKWNNLPNGINERWIERYLFQEGKCMFFNDKNKGLMVAKCGENSQLNYYDEATELRPIATNYDDSGTSYEVGTQCVLIKNNDDETPTDLTIKLYAHRLTDLTRTIDVNINAHKTPIIILTNAKQKNSLNQVYKQYNGNAPVIFADKDIDLNGVKVLKTDAPIVFDKLQIEKNHIWNECMTFLGINNANMDKRERLVDDEVQANNEQVDLFADIMLKNRQSACELINELFGTNISVEFRKPEKALNRLKEGGE